MFDCFLYNERSNVCLIYFLEEKKRDRLKNIFTKVALSLTEKTRWAHINKKICLGALNVYIYFKNNDFNYNPNRWFYFN